MIRILTKKERARSRRSRALAMGIGRNAVREFRLSNPKMYEHAFLTMCAYALKLQDQYRISHPITYCPREGSPGGPGAEILKRMNGASGRGVADGMGVSHPSLVQKIHNKQRITPDFAWKLAKYFNTTAKYWLEMQMEWDSTHPRKTVPAKPRKTKGESKDTHE